MKAEGFIARHLHPKGKMAIVAIAISFLVMIVAVAVSSGFSHEIRDAVAAVTGDIIVSNTAGDWYNPSDPVEETSATLSKILGIKGVKSAEPAIYRGGIAKGGDAIAGAMFKGSRADTVSMQARIPSSLARTLGLGEGDDLVAYFVGEKTKVRKFRIASVYDSSVDTGENPLIYVPASDLRRLNGWNGDESSVIEVLLEDNIGSRRSIKEMAAMTGSITGLAAVAAVDSYAQLFDWLDLIDYNVYAILVLMTVVTGFNMISGLLILLLRNISTIGTLKSLGMTDRGIAGVFLRVGARITGIGVLAGNAAALLFCLIQGTTHLIRLNPDNYFVSFVPVHVSPLQILAADAAAFAVIMILLLLPCLFISRIDPSLTVKTE